MPVARHFLRPTRELERAVLKRSPIWSCTEWGLQSFPGHPKNWCALTAPFHPYPARKRGGILSVALSFTLPRLHVMEHPALWCSDFPPNHLLDPATVWMARTVVICICFLSAFKCKYFSLRCIFETARKYKSLFFQIYYPVAIGTKFKAVISKKLIVKLWRKIHITPMAYSVLYRYNSKTPLMLFFYHTILFK